MEQGEHPVQAVVLSGGGAYAAYEVGILQGLTAGLVPGAGGIPQISVICGTSAGAYNAAFLVSRHNREWLPAIQELEQIWRNRIAGDNCENGVYRLRANPGEFLDPRCFLRDPARMLAKLGEDSAFLAQDWTRRAGLFAGRQKT
jgi:predicted acylesterase/phospholipase RssA